MASRGTLGGTAERVDRGARTLVAVATSEALPNLDRDSVPLLAALRERGVDARPTIWSDASVEWSAFDAVLVRSTWDYFDRLHEFLAWVERVPVPMINPADVVAWNAHKSYLRDLADRGVPTVDTVYVEHAASDVVPWRDAIVKPAVAGSAKGLRRAGGGERVEAHDGDLMIQPFLPSIQDEGELSLLYADGELSHAVRKVPKRGDIRVQPEWGGTTTLAAAGDEALAVAERALDAVGRRLAYARVDLVRAPDGTLRLIELELIEPNLFLVGNEAGTARFADALSAACAPSP